MYHSLFIPSTAINMNFAWIGGSPRLRSISSMLSHSLDRPWPCNLLLSNDRCTCLVAGGRSHYPATQISGFWLVSKHRQRLLSRTQCRKDIRCLSRDIVIMCIPDTHIVGHKIIFPLVRIKFTNLGSRCFDLGRERVGTSRERLRVTNLSLKSLKG